MGCGSSIDARTMAIDEQLYEDGKNGISEIKLLLLGPSESGKSTILKQMQIIHLGGFKTKDKLLPYRSVIYSNVVNVIYTICLGATQFDIQFSNPHVEATASEFLYEMDSIDMPFEEHFFRRVKTLISDASVSQIFEHQAELQIQDSAKYFLDHLDRLQKSDYIPSEEDVLKVRAATSGIAQVEFVFGETCFKVFDVGGQKSERRKWLHCFDIVHTVIFMVAISEYDWTLREDKGTNRMLDSLQLFASIVNVHYFQAKDMMLFLNKIDLFREKIGRISLRGTFPEFEGVDDYSTGLEFMKKKFLAENKNKQRIIMTHPTCATDTKQVKSVVDSVILAFMDINNSLLA